MRRCAKGFVDTVQGNVISLWLACELYNVGRIAYISFGDKKTSVTLLPGGFFYSCRDRLCVRDHGLTEEL
jgi:hypothetical protein